MLGRFLSVLTTFAIVVALFLSIPLGSEAYAANAVDWNGTWCNESSSSMEINVSDTGEVTGSYVNRAPGYCAQPDESFPLLGWTNGTLITFAVNWERCHSLTSWIGNYNPAQNTIIAPWTLIYRTYSGVDQDEDVDTFSRQCD